MNNFDKNTLGDSPACIYLIDLLNKIERKKAVYLIKSYGEFKETFKELVDAYEANALSAKVVRRYIATYRETIPAIRQSLVSRKYETTIINLYENLLIAEFKKVTRKLDAIKKLEISAISRAKSNLKKSGSSFNDKNMQTYGKYEGKEIPVEVTFDQHGLGSSVFNKELIEDKINSETLMEKSLKRLERRKAR